MTRALTGILAFTRAAGRCAGTLALAGITALAFTLWRVAPAFMSARLDSQWCGREQGRCRGSQRNSSQSVFLLHQVSPLVALLKINPLHRAYGPDTNLDRAK